MTISDKLIQEITENSTITYNSVDTECYTEELHEESHYAEDEEMILKVGELEYTLVFNVEYSWRCVNSGGDGWNDPNYDEAEDEEAEIEILYVYDEEGEEYEANYNEDKELMIKLEKFIENNLDTKGE